MVNLTVLPSTVLLTFCSDVNVSEILTSLLDSGYFVVGKAQSSSENSSVLSSPFTDAVASADI